MKDISRIDLHMHTTISDGTDEPEKILELVREKGIELFSITDHDAIEGSRRVRKIRTDEDPEFISGVEFSCKDEQGRYHILGYCYDPDTVPIQSVVDLGHGYRMNKLKKRLDFLDKEFGFSFPEEAVNYLYSQKNPGKPHIGNLMVRYGYADSKEQAITEYINKLHNKSEYVRPEEAIEGILASGGIPVLAHPSYGNGEDIIVGEEMDRRLRRMMDFGLMGVEAFYSGFTRKLQDEVLAFAHKYDLYVTAGSDYHGTNKMVILGDTNLKKEGEYPEGLKRFLKDIKEKI